MGNLFIKNYEESLKSKLSALLMMDLFKFQFSLNFNFCANIILTNIFLGCRVKSYQALFSLG